MNDNNNSGRVGALMRGLAVLDMFDRDIRTIGIGEMARALEVHKSSASRIAATLAAAGYLQIADGQGRYRLGHRLVSLGALAEEDSTLERVVVPHLRYLSEVTGETGHLAVLDAANALTIAVTEGWHTVRMHSWVGKTSPAYASSMGKALLAGLNLDQVQSLYPQSKLPKATEKSLGNTADLISSLESIRRDGFALDDEELEIGLRCVAAPILDLNGQVVASISVSGPSQRLSPSAMKQVAKHVLWAAGQASVALGGSSHPTGWPSYPKSPPAPLPFVEKVRPVRRQTSEASRDRLTTVLL